MTGCLYLLLSVFLAAAAVQDLRQRSISSRLLLTGTVLSILIRLFTDHLSFIFILTVAADLFLPALLLFPLFLIRALGAGDIRICMLISCGIGFPAAFRIIYLAFVLGCVRYLLFRAGRRMRQREPFAWTFLLSFLIFILFCKGGS